MFNKPVWQFSENRIIYKYPIPLRLFEHGEFELKLGAHPAIVHVGLDAERKACIWAEVDGPTPDPDVLVKIGLDYHIGKFRKIGTGIEFQQPGLSHIATYLQESYVWHLFEVLSVKSI